MKIAIVYNRDSQAVINLFGTPNREKYGLATIERIKEALEWGGHQVKTFEGDKNIIHVLEGFMPSVISGERPGLVFNLSYGIQGRARYTHIPAILEMLGIPYVGSGPETHAVALDKVLTKMVLLQKGLPTPKFTVLETPEFKLPLQENLAYPLIVKPKDEAVSFGLKIVHNENELREGVRTIYENFKAPTLVEEYIDGREFNVGLLGNDPVEALPPVELLFSEGEKVYTYEDKVKKSGRTIEKVCPPVLEPEHIEQLKSLAIASFKALGCSDSARVDFRMDWLGNIYILEINSMASLGLGGSYVYAAEKVGLDYNSLTNRLIETTTRRYFGTVIGEEQVGLTKDNKQAAAFRYLTQNRDKLEDELKNWTNLSGWTGDPVGLGASVKQFEGEMKELGMLPVRVFTNRRSAWTWQTGAGMEGGTLLVAPLDVPREGGGGYPIPFRQDSEWLYGEGIASSRAGITCILQSLKALKVVNRLQDSRLGVFIYSDEGRGMRYSSQILQQAAQHAGRVIVMMPGFRGGSVVDQRRGSRKFSIVVEGAFQRIGFQGDSDDVLSWFLHQTTHIGPLSRPEERLSVAVQEVSSERYSMLLPHRVRATVYVTFLDAALADEAEKQLRALFTSKAGEQESLRIHVEKLEERPPLNRSEKSAPLISRLKQISEAWKLPFGVESGLLPSAAGEIPHNIPVICGFGPASQNLFTPHEGIHRGELLQRVLLLTLFLMDSENEA